MKILKNKYIVFFLLTIVLLIFLKVDYRFKYTIECCSDEYDYFIHAVTIVEDFDLDYSNQNLRGFRYTNEEINAPVGFVGTGILLAPFLYLGDFINEVFNETIHDTLFNYQILMYSLGSVFYFFLAYYFIFKTMKLLNYSINRFKLLFIYSASGLPYYAFERFGMTHVFEVVTISALIYLLSQFYLTNQRVKLNSLIIPVLLFLSFSVRMSNFYIFLIPYIIYKFLDNEFDTKNRLFKSKYFISSLFLSTYIYYQVNIQIYGKFIINPQLIYSDSRSANDYVKSIFDIPSVIFEIAQSSLNVLFTFEFGLFWMSPILFFGTVVCLYLILDIKKIENILLFLCFAQNFIIVFLWQSLGSSYGFRYLFSLIPISLFILFVLKVENKIVINYLTYFSVLSLLGVLFFETTELTQLSTIPEVNSFGKLIRYVEPIYVRGLILSFFEFESYLRIFTTSFLGAIFFKIFITFYDLQSVNKILSSLNLPTENQDFQNYLLNINEVSFDKFLIIFLTCSYIAYNITFKLKE